MPYNKEEGRGTQMKRRPMRRRKKVCVYCVDKNAVIDYKDTNKLKRYISKEIKFFLEESQATVLNIRESLQQLSRELDISL